MIVRKARHLLWPGVIAAAALFSGCKTRTSVSSQVRASELPRPDAATLAMFNKYCSGCHAAYAGGGDQAWAGIRRDALEISARLDWDNAEKDQVMPPADSDQHGLLASAPGDRARMRNAVKGASAGGLATELPWTAFDCNLVSGSESGRKRPARDP